MRVGLFGGTFDPPHTGHLLAATDAVDALGLDEIVFIPAATQPFKQGQVGADAAARVEMTRRLARSLPGARVDAMEVERGGLSFTVETLEVIAARQPDAERYFLIGEDAFAAFENWKAPARILELATLAVLRRGGEPNTTTEETSPSLARYGGRVIALPTRRVDVSSTEVRARVRAGRSIGGFVPEAVAEYIAAARLYR